MFWAPSTTNRKLDAAPGSLSCVKTGSGGHRLSRAAGAIPCFYQQVTCQATKPEANLIKNQQQEKERGASEVSMKDPKQETPSSGRAQAAAGATRAEKVRSSRYEWEGKSGENENPAPKTKAARGSLWTSFAIWLKRLFSWERDFFDKDDDATPSAA